MQLNSKNTVLFVLMALHVKKRDIKNDRTAENTKKTGLSGSKQYVWSAYDTHKFDSRPVAPTLVIR